MKKIGLSLFTLIIFTFMSCKLNLPTLTAKIEDENYKAVYILAVHGGINENQKGFVIMAGDNPDLKKAKYLAFAVRGDKPGEYNISTLTVDSLPQVAALYSPIGQGDTLNKYLATDGFVKITNVDLNKKQINGQFEFILKNKRGDTLNVENGKFENILFVNIDDIMSDIEQFKN